MSIQIGNVPCECCGTYREAENKRCADCGWLKTITIKKYKTYTAATYKGHKLGRFGSPESVVRFIEGVEQGKTLYWYGGEIRCHCCQKMLKDIRDSE